MNYECIMTMLVYTSHLLHWYHEWFFSSAC